MEGLVLALALLTWSCSGLLLLMVACLAIRTMARMPGERASWKMGRSPADLRAEELLHEVLAETEYRQLMERGYLEVPSPHNEGRIYRVPLDDGLVHVYEQGELTRRLCVQPVEYLPRYDIIVMHKLMIDCDEDEYLARANAFPPLFGGW
jgi:hypothetical protein